MAERDATRDLASYSTAQEPEAGEGRKAVSFDSTFLKTVKNKQTTVRKMYRKVKPVMVERMLNRRLTKKFTVGDVLRIKDSCIRSDHSYLPVAEIKRLYPNAIVDTVSDLNVVIDVDDETKQQHIAIAGSTTVAHTAASFNYKKGFSEELKAFVHWDWHQYAKKVWEVVKPNLKEGYSLNFVGHSLGGVCAVENMIFAKAAGFTCNQTITFGQPKFVNGKGAKKYRDLDVLRVRMNRDPYPLWPISGLFTRFDHGVYVHFGPELILYPKAKYEYYPADNLRKKFELIGITVDIESHQIMGYMDNLHTKAIILASKGISAKKIKEEE